MDSGSGRPAALSNPERDGFKVATPAIRSRPRRGARPKRGRSRVSGVPTAREPPAPP